MTFLRTDAKALLPNPAAALAVVWTTAYALVRVSWQHRQPFGPLSPIGTDLVVFTGWRGTALCGAAGVTALALMSLRTRGLLRSMLLWLGGGVSTALVAAGALLLVDVVAGFLPGLGIPFSPTGAASRVACVGAGILLGRATLTYARRTGDGCRVCGQIRALVPGGGVRRVTTRKLRSQVGCRAEAPCFPRSYALSLASVVGGRV